MSSFSGKGKQGTSDARMRFRVNAVECRPRPLAAPTSNRLQWGHRVNAVECVLLAANSIYASRLQWGHRVNAVE